MNTNFKQLSLFLFILLFGLLAYFSAGLKLYLDDLYYAYPSFFGNYAEHITGYFRNYGFFRPISLFYYYLVLEVYQIAPYLAHQIPLLIYFGGVYFFYRLYKFHQLSGKLAFLSLVTLLSFPWSVEGWAWFSANPSVIVILLLGLQIYLAEKYQLTLKNLLILFILQIFIVFTYDSPLLIPFPLTFLLLTKNITHLKEIKNKAVEFILISLLLFIPTIVNLTIRSYIQPGMDIRFRMINFSEAVVHWGNIIYFFKTLFSLKAFQEFWIGGSSRGLSLIFGNPVTALSFLLVMLIIIKSLFDSDKSASKNINNKRVVLFWLLSFILSLIPLSWQKTYSPFRTFILPALFLYSAIIYWLNSNYKKIQLSPVWSLIIKISFLYSVVIFFSLQVHMVDSYIRQYEMDKKITSETEHFLKNLGIDKSDSVYIYFAKVPNNNLWSFVYGDFILSSYYHYWTAEYFYKIHTGYWKNIGIELDYNGQFLSKYSKDYFLNQKSLILLKYNGYKKCLYDECYEYLNSQNK